MTRRTFNGAAAGAALVTPAAGAADPIAIGTRRELFVDRALIETMRGSELRPAIPVDAGQAFAFDRPWEGAFSAYFTAIAVGGAFRLYYRGNPISRDGAGNEVTCCAESPDGIRWSRPALDLYEPGGARRNNVILAGEPPFSHNFAPFRDRRPGVPEAERYKAVAGTARTGLHAWISADGLHWSRLQREPVLPPPDRFALDSQNNAFWSEQEKQYVLYYRTWKQIGAVNYRWISRAVSDDFRRFTPAGEMEFGGAPPEHLYTNQTGPYFRAPHLYVGICARFMPGRQVLSEAQAHAIHVDPKYFQDCSDAVLVTSRGGNRYDRTFLEGFLRPGTGMENWVSRSNYPALNVVQTGRSTMSFYVNRNYGQPTAHLQRYELRLDGFASLHSGYAGGEAVTRPLIFEGSRLELNFSTSAAGAVRVELQDSGGTPIPGYTLGDARELVGDEVDRTYEWRGGPDLAGLRGRPVRFRIVLQDADLYSFRTRGESG